MGGNNVADVQRLTIVADPSNANGSTFGGIRAGNAVFGGAAGVVGISAANVQVQNTVVIGDINTTSAALPTLTFGSNSNFATLRVAGGDLENNLELTTSGISQILFTAGTDSAGRTIPEQGLDNKGPTAVTLSNTVSTIAEDASTASRVKVADIAVTDDGRGTNSLALSGADASKFELVGNALFLKAGTALNFEGQTSYGVTVTASDANSRTAAVSTSYTLGVSNVNEAPTITSSGSVSTIEDTAIAFTVVGADVDAGTTLTYTAGSATQGTITGGTNGGFVYTPNANANGADSFVVTVSDGKLSTTQTVNVAITAVNDAPVAVADTATSVVMGNTATINVLANDTDVDANTLSISGTPTATLGTVTVVDGALRYVAPANYIGSATISYSITDGTATENATQTVSITQPTISRSAESVDEGGSATFTIHGAPSTDYAISLAGTATPGTDYAGAALAQVTTNASGVATFTLAPGRDKSTEGAETVIASIVGFAGSQTITIGDVSVNNVAPAFTSSATDTGTEDTVKTFTVAATDGNAEDTVAYSLGAVVGGTATITGGTVTFTPTADFNGDASVVVNATDGTATTSQTVAITVAAVNDTPTLAAIDAQNGTEDTALNFTAVGSDIDAGDTLTYTASGATKGTVTGGVGGVFTYTPTADANGDDTVTVTVTDASGAVAIRTVSINLAATNDVPTFAAATATASPVAENTATTATVFTAAGSDIDGNTLSYSLAGADAASFTINAATGAVRFAASPNFEVQNSYAFDVVASDGTATATQSVALAVTNVNESPILGVASDSVTIDENTIATTTFAAVDPEGNGISYTLSGLDAALFQIVGNKLSFIAAPNYEVPTDANRDGIYSVTIVATDSAGLASTASVVVTVANVVENNSFTLSFGANDVNAININERVTIDGSITNSFQAIDTIRGGSGTDTLTVQLDGATMRADMTGVENLITTNSNNASTLNMVDVTGLTSITQLAGNAATTYNNLANIVSLTMDSTTTDVAVNYADAALAAAGDDMTITLSSATAGTITVGRAAGATNALSSVSLVSDTLPNTLTALAVTGAGVSTVNISGSQSLNIVGALQNGITTVAAGSATGAITLATGAAGVALTTGSGAADLTGGAGADVISSGDGNDVIVASAGNDVINAGDGNDAVQFTAALFEGNSATTATYAGGAGTNTIAVTETSLLGTDADFAGVTGFQALTLTGASTVVLGTNANTAGIATVNAGNGNTSITSTVVASLAINANAFVGQDDTLTVASTAAVTITNLDGDLAAAGSTGAMSASFKNAVDDAHAFTTGSGNTTVSGAGATDTITVTSNILEAGSLTISGAAAVTATSVLENVDASGSTGAVTLTFDDATDHAIAVTAGSGNLVLTGVAAGDTITVTGAATEGQVIVGSVAKFNITAGDNAQSITGGAANDTISAGAGNDTIVASLGNDVVTAGDGNDAVQFTAALFEGNSATTATYAGGAGTNTIAVTETSLLGTDADFAGVTGFQALTLTGASTVVLGTNANTAGIATVNAGNGNTSITSTVVASLAINANAFVGQDDTLTVASTAAVTITNLDGDLAAAGSTGAMSASFKNAVDDAHAFTTGSGNTTVSGAGATDTITVTSNILEAGSLTISGAAAVTATSVLENVDASGSTGTVALTFTDATDNAIAVTAGSGHLFLTGGAAGDTITVTGAATTAQIITGQVARFNVTAGDGAQVITTDVAADTITAGAGGDVITGGGGADVLNGGEGEDTYRFATAGDLLAATINDSGANTIQMTGAAVIADTDLAGKTGISSLNLSGASSVTLGGNALLAGVGTVVAGAGATTVNSAYGVTVNASALTDLTTLTLQGAGDFTVTNMDGLVNAAATTGAVNVSLVDDALADGNNHTVITGSGATTVTAAGATDTVSVSGNASVITAAGSAEFAITGDIAGQVIIGSAQADTIAPGGGFDNVSAGGGIDTINTTLADLTDNATGADTLDGGAGSDTLNITSVGGDVGPLQLANVSGLETLNVSTAIAAVTTTITLDQATVARNVDANNAFTLTVTDFFGDDDTITVSAAGVTSNLNVTVNQLAVAGAVSITTGSGADTITGSAGRDVITANGGNDTINADAGNDDIFAGAGNDTLLGDAGDDLLSAGDGDDSLNGGDDNDTLTGGLGIDTFDVDSGIDTINDLGVGADLLIVSLGATANATITTGTWAPIAGGAENDGTVTLTLAAAATGVDLTNASGNGSFTINAGTGGDAITGSANGDVINGNTGADTIYGGGGDDTILGNGGADVIFGGAGEDAIEGGLGADTLTGGAEIDTFTLTSTLTTDAITDFVLGVGGDVLEVDESDLGLAGHDVYVGGAGGVDDSGAEEIVVLNAVSYISDAAAAEAVAASVTTDALAMVIVYHNSTTGKVHVIHTTNSDTGAGVSLIATMDNVTTLAGLATGVAGNFGGRP